ncbi:hypothetical protein DCCM_2067 [Desulfocucumis palustris]|uniref:Uncharacterized protein n=1 Tax=Desulfocucumis palustris TaxID=1898651 RepID=A0A2L2XA71_9FIRM|nr:hypothetical protein [Desulfocucumis palustris]GBF32970.1 hypothetical protein DCCM_2067 [Desulfocucumis palustris]
MQRPAGITVISIYSLLSGLFSIFVGTLTFMSLQAEKSPEHSWLIAMSLFSVVTGVLELLVYHGLWNFKKWGYHLAKYLYFLYIPLGIVMILVDSSPANIVIQLAYATVSVLIVIYLLKPEVENMY